MHGERLTAPRWAIGLGVGLVGLLLLAYIVPSLANPTATLAPSPTPSPTPVPTRTSGPGTTTITTKVTEQEMNQWLQDSRPSVAGGVDLRDLRITILQSGITLSGTMQVAQLPNALVPVQIRVRPVLHEERWTLDVLDVQLGGPYAAMSGMIKPLLTAGIAGALDAEGLTRQQGVRITSIDLQDGYLVVTSVPTAGSQ